VTTSPTSPPPPAPDAASRALLFDHLRLARAPGVGARTARLLLERCGSVAAVFADGPAALEARGVPRRVARSLHDPALARAGRTELDRIAALDLGLLGLELPGFPDALRTVHDPPLVLTARGALSPADERAIAVVGARRATPAGLEVARQLAFDLAAAGVTVVSGLARGIDQAAHSGALAAGGRTLAVLGSGLARVYPAQHAPLAERIARQGAVLSELPPDQGPTRHTFPQRNRIIAGLAAGVVVVQAGPRSGALITAGFALDEGRAVAAVPGDVLEPLARGPNGLIKDGAALVESADDVLEACFGVTHRPPLDAGEEPEPPAGSVEHRLLTLLRPAPRDLDALAAETGLEARAVMTALGRLEALGQVRAAPTGRYAVTAAGAGGQ